MNGNVQETLIERLRPTISPDRLGTYLTAAGFDAERALRLYIWSAYIGEAFHLPIQAAEVALQNRIDAALRAAYGVDWWANTEFLQIGSRERQADIETAKRRITRRNQTVNTPQMVANLSFGFWVGTLRAAYNPTIWSRQLRIAFPNLPSDKNRYSLAGAAKRVADLRNRIWHHEPIFRMSLSEEFSAVMELLLWVCPTKEGWIRPQCRVQRILRQKP
jgi:hypothetical protein